MVISDIHVGAPFVDQARLRAIVARANALDGDLIVLVGDYVTGEVPFRHPFDIDSTATSLGELRPRYGVRAILGNQDWGFGPIRVRTALEDAGIDVLVQESVSVLHQELVSGWQA